MALRPRFPCYRGRSDELGHGEALRRGESCRPRSLDLPGTRRRSTSRRPSARSADLSRSCSRIATLAAAGKFYVNAPNIHHDWVTFVVLAAAATVAQVVPGEVAAERDVPHSVVFLVAAALLLPPELIVLIPLVQTIPEWLKERTPWPIQASTSRTTRSTRSRRGGCSHSDQRPRRGSHPNAHARFAIAGLAACVFFVVDQPHPRRGHPEARPRPQLPGDGPLHARRASRSTSCSRFSASRSRRSGTGTRG